MTIQYLKGKSARATFILLCQHDFFKAMAIYQKRLKTFNLFL